MTSLLLLALTPLNLGAAYQYFMLQYRKSGMAFTALYLFIFWILPLPIAGVMSIADSKLGVVIMYFSMPTNGLYGLSLNDNRFSASDIIPGVAFNIVLTIIMFCLSYTTARKLTKQTMETLEKKAQAD